ncbi:hypothetical protein FPFC_031360 [Fructobacillus pseudoficulneus]|uniref:HTH lysR-type domain-containing protein n=1 Tax=Fructobacillus pseudoficulneus TaxID=220714 RepID=A0A3F3GU33_9LACO|nr:LysR family transcriptional regulator [Fructobacillus pseudoficulneus]GAP02951.1 hypothetical protein FPFC_031360 [Fructobacillus pseudoficulneus]SEH44880.1 DNA-binding transcriptional regulator, LysR family [Fructobacillus pseudoficulneus]
MEIRLLQYFLKVAETQNITQAAAELHITQPTLSRQIHAFEERLQTNLFIRDNKKLTLTDSGRFLKAKAEELVALDQKTEQEFATYQDRELTGKVTIGCIESENSTFMAQIMKTMRQKHEQVTFEIYSGNGNDILDKLENGLLDLAFMVGPLNPDMADFHLTHLPGKEILGVVVTNDSPLAQKEGITAEDIKRLPIIGAKREAVQESFYHWGNFQPEELNIIGMYNLIFNVLPMVREGVGVALAISGSSIGDEDGTKFIPLTPTLAADRMLVWKKNRILSPTAQEFIQLVNHASKASDEA